MDDRDSASFEVFRLHGNPTPEEQTAVLDALEAMLARERSGPATTTAGVTSAWKLSGRLTARRGGILDARTTLGPGGWPATARLPWSGRGYEGRRGRGDSR